MTDAARARGSESAGAAVTILSWDVVVRLASAAITVVLVLTFDQRNDWIALVISLGFTHYLLSLYYARRRIHALVADSDLWLPLVGLTAFFGLVYWLEFPLEVYFGIHHAFNEGYLRRYQARDGSGAERGQAGLRSLLHLAAYLVVLRDVPYVREIPEPALWGFLAVSVALWSRAQRAERGGWTQSGVEWLALLLVMASLWVNITFLQLVLYHFVLWTLVPIPVLRRQGSARLAEYGLLTVAFMLVFGVVTFSQLFANYLTLAFMLTQFYLWSYVHITSSFALSSAHPGWMVRLFQPATAR